MYRLLARILTSSLVLGLSVYCCQRTSAEFFPGDLFELRPPRVRVASASEIDKGVSRQSFAFQEPPPPSPMQTTIPLSDVDILAAVFPVHRGSFVSGGVSYEVGGVQIEGERVTLDFYAFLSLTGGYGDALVAPWEQSVLLGQLPAGTYEFNLRRWHLQEDDRAGFDPAAIDPVSDNGGFVFVDSSTRFFTEQRFDFVVHSTAVPEPMSIGLAAVLLVLTATVRVRHGRLLVS